MTTTHYLQQGFQPLALDVETDAAMLSQGFGAELMTHP
jgi:hypothetical protein